MANANWRLSKSAALERSLLIAVSYAKPVIPALAHFGQHAPPGAVPSASRHILRLPSSLVRSRDPALLVGRHHVVEVPVALAELTERD